MNVEPYFTSRPEKWAVTQDTTLPLSLSPAATAEFRTVNLGCTFLACNLLVQVPMQWDADRVNTLVNKFKVITQHRPTVRRYEDSEDDE